MHIAQGIFLFLIRMNNYIFCPWSKLLWRMIVVMIDVWDSVSAFVGLRRMFLSTDLKTKHNKQIALATMDILYIRFTN